MDEFKQWLEDEIEQEQLSRNIALEYLLSGDFTYQEAFDSARDALVILNRVLDQYKITVLVPF